MPGGAWTERVLRVDSLADAAKLARAWIEERLKEPPRNLDGGTRPESDRNPQMS